MATFTSTQSGDWNDGGTWGNASPGVKGTDWPGNAADVANVGHHVCYNVSETNELGDVNITSGGNLYFSNSQSTKLTLGNTNLNLAAYGRLTVGNSGVGNIIPSSYTAEIYWNTTADNAKGINTVDSAYLNVFGDPAYYGSSFLGYMVNTWQGGQTFIMSGDFYSRWLAGQKVVVHKYSSYYSNYITDIAEYTISSIWSNGGNTSILISEAAPGSATVYNAGGRILNVTRNIKLAKLNYGTAVQCLNTNRPSIKSTATGSGTTSILNNCEVGGMNRVEQDRGLMIYDTVFRNGYYGIDDVAYSTVEDTIFFSNNNGMFTVDNCLLNNIVCVGNQHGIYVGNKNECINFICYSNNYGTRAIKNSDLYGLVYCNNVAHREAENVDFDIHMWGNADGYYYGMDVYHLGGAIGFDENNNNKPNGTAFIFNGYNKFYVSGTKVNSPLGYVNRNTVVYDGSVNFADFDDIPNNLVRAHMYYSLVLNSTITRSGGADKTLQVIPLYNIVADRSYIINDWYEFDVETGAELNRTVYVMGTGWTTFPRSGRLCLEATYFDQSSGISQATATSTNLISANSTWTPLTVAFTPQNSCCVRYRVYLQDWENNAEIFIDNQLRGVL